MRVSKLPLFQRIFIIWIVIYPIIIIYELPFIPGLQIGNFVLIIMVMLLSIEHIIWRKVKISYTPLVLLLFVFFHFIFYVIWIGNANSTLILKTGHYIFYLFIVIFLTKNIFEYEYALKVLKKVSIVSSVYLMMQYSLYAILGFHLSGIIPFWESNHSPEVYIDNGIVFLVRFQSFFSEPAAFATYTCTCLILCLYRSKTKITDYIPEIIMSIAVLLSQSASGAGLLIIIWGIFLFRHFRKLSYKLKKNILFCAALLLPVFIFVFYQAGIFSFILRHVINTTDNSVSAGYGLIGRASYLEWVFDFKSLSTAELLFGKGMIGLIPGVDTFVPGFGLIFMYYGVLGLAVFGGVYIYLLLKLKNEFRVLILCMMISSVFADSIFGIAGLQYFAYIFAKNSESEKVIIVKNKLLKYIKEIRGKAKAVKIV